MTLSKLLLRHTNVGDLVWITDCGWYIGCTLDSFSITITCKEFREDVAVRSPFGK